MGTSYTKKKKQVHPSLPCPGCGKPRQNRTGRPAAPQCRACGKRPLADRFLDGINHEGPIPPHRPELGPCWISGYALPAHGYPHIMVAGRGSELKGAHIVSWFLHYGSWPALCVMHLCDNRACVRWEHLREGTRGDNNRDSVAKGRNSHGERHPISKLTDAQVHEIRARYAAGGVTQLTLATDYGASSSVISRIITRKIWRAT